MVRFLPTVMTVSAFALLTGCATQTASQGRTAATVPVNAPQSAAVAPADAATANQDRTKEVVALNQPTAAAAAPVDSADALAAAGRKDFPVEEALAKKSEREFPSSDAEFTLAESYENNGHDDLAVPLYRDLIQKGSNTHIASTASFNGNLGRRIGATYADESQNRLNAIAQKQLIKTVAASRHNGNFAALTAKFNLATGYQNKGKYTQARLLYKDMVVTGVNAAIIVRANQDGSSGQLLDRNLSEESARRLRLMSGKHKRVIQGLGDASPVS